VASGTEVKRPKGQIKLPDAENPVFGPTRQLDYELETAFVVGKSNQLGEPVPIAEAEDYLYGMVLFNDWSARDIQAWEYQPLGPFGGKNFASVVSPWIVTMEALEPFRLESPAQDPEPLPYLQLAGKHHYDIMLEVWLVPHGQKEEVLLGRTNHKYLYWSQAQQLAHHTANGCNLEVGDLCGSGTISGPTPDSLGCLLEATQRGKFPITLPDGSTRAWVQDGDEIILKGYAGEGENRVDFGECRSRIVA
jgi:fumarylacetoacetase